MHKLTHRRTAAQTTGAAIGLAMNDAAVDEAGTTTPGANGLNAVGATAGVTA